MFDVVLNEESQYSIWPSEHPIPQGWSPVGVQGDREHCLAHIRLTWTDMRPASLRRALEEWKRSRTSEKAP